jgi:hypothetical protein
MTTPESIAAISPAPIDTQLQATGAEVPTDARE